MAKTQPIIMLHALFDEILHNQKQIKTILLFIYFLLCMTILDPVESGGGQKGQLLYFPRQWQCAANIFSISITALQESDVRVKI